MSKRTILLADDDPGLRRLIGATLGADSFQILSADDGGAALAIAHGAHPALILLDINMPGQNGLDVCRQLKSDPATAPIKIIMLTASGQELDRRRAFEAAADDYVVKPFSPIALLDKVYALLS